MILKNKYYFSSVLFSITFIIYDNHYGILKIELALMFPIMVFLRLVPPHFKSHQRQFPFS